MANTVGPNQKARVGQVVLTGTISGSQFSGYAFLRPNEPNLFVGAPPDPDSSARCFGQEQKHDAEGVVDATAFRWKWKTNSYNKDSCVIVSDVWSENTVNFR